MQYQEEILRRTWVRRFHIPICRCTQCAQRVQGRHPLQTSDALGAAAVQIGPEAVTLGVLMNKAHGLPHADAAALLQHGFGLTMSRSGICRAIQRVARKAEATWHALRDAARKHQEAMRRPLTPAQRASYDPRRLIKWMYTVPYVTGKIKDAKARYYVALRFSIGRNVSQLMAANPSTLVQLARTLNAEKEHLLRDLRDGTLRSDLDIPPDIRGYLEPRAKKAANRAQELAATAEKLGRARCQRCIYHMATGTEVRLR